MHARWLLLLLLAACGPSRGYQARSILHEGDIDARAMRTLGCVDVGFGLRFVGNEAPMLRTRFGNRCPEPVVFDLTRVRIVGHSGHSGTDKTRALAFDDPRAEVVTLHLDGVTEGMEKLRLVDDGKAGGALDAICIHVDELVPEAPDTHAGPVCFARPATASPEWQVSEWKVSK